MFRAAAACAILVGLTLSGCVGSEGDSGGAKDAQIQEAAPAAFDESTGAIVGLITDDQIQPIAGAQVGVLENPDASTTTDVGGRFTLSNLVPGDIKLAVQALGYESVARSVRIDAGAITEVQVNLVPLASEEPYAEQIIWSGLIACSVAYVRSVLQYGSGATCPGGTTVNNWNHNLYKKGWPTTWKSIMIEAQWSTQDFLGFDFVDRTAGAMYGRVREQSPVHFYFERCGDYTKTHFARMPVFCTDEEVEASKTTIETWYIGQYQDETHNADIVCQQSTPYWPAYQQGCYGVGVAFDLKWTNYITVFHREIPADVDTYTFLPDR